MQSDQLWIELGPHDGKPPRRLLVFLHGAGSSPELFTPLALAWQYKFPGAAAIVMQGLLPGATGQGFDWYPVHADRSAQFDAIRDAATEVSRRVEVAQSTMQLDRDLTSIVGFSQGASLAIEMARLESPCADVMVGHASRLLRPIQPGASIEPTIHLVHGELDSLVPAQHSVRAYRALRNAGVRASIDVITDGVHSIGQDMVNVGTTRVMQTVFRHRRSISLEQYGGLLSLSLDTDGQVGIDPEISARH